MHGRIAACLVALGIAAPCSCPSMAHSEYQDGKEAKNQERLRGKWLLQTRVVNGKRLKSPDGVSLLITNDGMMKTYSPVGSTDGPGPTLVGNVFYRIGVTQDHATIDQTGRPDWTDVEAGIYRLDDDSLTLCIAAKNKPRPTAFSSRTGDGKVLLFYKRAQNGQ